MSMKGMEMGMRILFVVVAIMAVVLIMIAIFSGGAQQLGGTFESWAGQTKGEIKECSGYTTAGECTLLKGCRWCPNAPEPKCKSLSEECPKK